jgi:hypothetical protein
MCRVTPHELGVTEIRTLSRRSQGVLYFSSALALWALPNVKHKPFFKPSKYTAKFGAVLYGFRAPSYYTAKS